MPDPHALDALREAADDATARAPAVSAWAVGKHVEHCVLAMLGVGRALLGSAPPAPPRGLALWQRVILLGGRIPRGRARAPDKVVPGAVPTRAELNAHLDEAAACLARVREAPPGAWFEHFVLGVMTRDHALRFLQVHNRHHLRIVADIRAARDGG